MDPTDLGNGRATVTLHHRSTYRWCMTHLDLASELRRRVAENDIERDPDHREGRVEVFLGGRLLVLQATDTLLTYYHRIDADNVCLDLVLPSAPLPEWFTNPDSSWFRDIDLTGDCD